MAKVHEKVLDKSTFKNLGRSEAVRSNQISPVTLAQVSGDDERGEAITVTLQVERENAGPWTGDPAPVGVPVGVALLEWGQSGYQANAEIDFANGLTFTLHCSSLRIKASIDAQFIGNDDMPIKLAAFVAYGTRPSSAFAPTRTINLGTVSSMGTTPLFPIPQFARAMRLLPSSWGAIATPDVYAINIHSITGTPIYSWLSNMGPVPISNDARRFSITNPTAGNRSLITLWELAF